VTCDPGLATWLLTSRREIERHLASQLGQDMPGAASAEAEALRRFRSFAISAVRRGEVSAPALDGLRVRPVTTARLVDGWIRSAADVAGPDGPILLETLAPLARSFTTALRSTTVARRASGAPRRSSRRAVSAAIDRVADAFLAIDVESGSIADANPAAGALLGVSRDRLVESEALTYVSDPSRGAWATHLEAMSEGGEPRRFHTELCDAGGSRVRVEARVTRLATRRRTLALVMVRTL
jgi:PAS domain S-box-containing protein